MNASLDRTTKPIEHHIMHMDITILELTFPDSQFNAPFSGQTNPRSAASGDRDQSDESTASPPTSVLRPVMVGLVILGLALVAKYLRDNRSTEQPTDESQKTLDRL